VKKAIDREPWFNPRCLPCPFCGLFPFVQYWHGGSPKKRAVTCDNEECPASPMVTGKSEDEAVMRWNQRP
jgi:hypothetical protein